MEDHGEDPPSITYRLEVWRLERQFLLGRLPCVVFLIFLLT
jgi:hypothetical protein